MGFDHLHAGPRRRGPTFGMAWRPHGLQAAVHPVYGGVHGRISPVHPCMEPELADLCAGDPGHRRRDDHANHHGHDLPHGAPGQDRLGDGDLRDSAARCPCHRPDSWRVPGRVRELAMDLHDQPSHRGDRNAARVLHPAGVPEQAPGQVRCNRGSHVGSNLVLPAPGPQQRIRLGLGRRENDHAVLRKPGLARPFRLRRADLG